MSRTVLKNCWWYNKWTRAAHGNFFKALHSEVSIRDCYCNSREHPIREVYSSTNLGSFLFATRTAFDMIRVIAQKRSCIYCCKTSQWDFFTAIEMERMYHVWGDLFQNFGSIVRDTSWLGVFWEELLGLWASSMLIIWAHCILFDSVFHTYLIHLQ